MEQSCLPSRHTSTEACEQKVRVKLVHCGDLFVKAAGTHLTNTFCMLSRPKITQMTGTIMGTYYVPSTVLHMHCLIASSK